MPFELLSQEDLSYLPASYRYNMYILRFSRCLVMDAWPWNLMIQGYYQNYLKIFFLISFNYGYILAIVFNLFDCDDLNAFTISCYINQNVYVCVSMFSKALGGRQAVGGG